MLALLREKLEVRGDVLVLAEESHTSRMSLAHSDPMRIHPAQAKIAKAAASKPAKILAKSEPAKQKSNATSQAGWGPKRLLLLQNHPTCFSKNHPRRSSQAMTPRVRRPRPPPSEQPADPRGRHGLLLVCLGRRPDVGVEAETQESRPALQADGHARGPQRGLQHRPQGMPRFACHPGLSLAFRVWGFPRGGGWAQVPRATSPA